MDFPALFADKAELQKAVAVAVNRRKDGGDGKFLVELESESPVRNVKPDFEKLSRAANTGVIVTTRGDSKYDFISRYFAC